MAAENGGLQPREFKKIAVFCGASSGGSPVYVEAAKALGEEMVRRGIGLVYGGEQHGRFCSAGVGLIAAAASWRKRQPGTDGCHKLARESCSSGPALDLLSLCSMPTPSARSSSQAATWG